MPTKTFHETSLRKSSTKHRYITKKYVEEKYVEETATKYFLKSNNDVRYFKFVSINKS